MWFASTAGIPPSRRTRSAASTLFIVVLLIGFAIVGSGVRLFAPTGLEQTPSSPQCPDRKPARTRSGGKPDIQVQSTLVLIPVTVVDPLYRFVTGLKVENFRLFEDQIEQAILQLSVEDVPVSIGIVFDCSGSMRGKLQQSRRGVTEFLKTANPKDEFFLLLFRDRSELTVDFTNSMSELQNHLFSLQADGNTALLDALYLALHRIRFGNAPRKALLLISDGGENSSRYTEREVKELAQESDVQVFAIGIYKRVPSDPEGREAFSGRTLMARIAEFTGGFQYPVQNIDELPAIAATMGDILRHQYVLAYSPANKQLDGKYRRVSIRIELPVGRTPVRAYWRTGYYAPDSLH